MCLYLFGRLPSIELDGLSDMAEEENHAADMGKTAGVRKREKGMRVVITGKGGAGKTTLTALLANLFAQEGKCVLAIDGDPRQHLAAALGILPSTATGIVPVTGGASDHQEARDIVDRFSVPAGRNVRLVVTGGTKEDEEGRLCPGYTLLAALLRNLKANNNEVIILDTPAGLEHFGKAVVEGVTCAVVVTDHSYNAVSVARKSAALARQLGIGNVILVINRAQNETGIRNTCGSEGGIAEFSQTIVLPFEPGANLKESLTDSTSVFTKGVSTLMAAIAGRCESWSPPIR